MDNDNAFYQRKEIVRTSKKNIMKTIKFFLIAIHSMQG